jgi:hypothetical protein
MNREAKLFIGLFVVLYMITKNKEGFFKDEGYYGEVRDSEGNPINLGQVD